MAGERLWLTKLVVGDLDAAIAFYGAVCGFNEQRRIDAAVDERAITEVILGSATEAMATLVLLTFHDTPTAVRDECMLVFETDDADAFVARAVAAGGAVMQPAASLPDHGLRVAFVRDPEGHVLEALQRL